MQTMEWVKVFLLGMLTAFVGVLVFSPGRGVALADAAAQGGGLMAVAAGDRLYLIDPANKQIAQYTVDSTGFYLRGARWFGHDLNIYDLYDEKINRGNKRLSVKDAKAAKSRSRGSYEEAE